MQHACHDAGFGVRPENHRAGAITEQHCSAAIFPVDDPRIHFGADNQGAAMLARSDQVVGDRQRVNETAADGLNIERGAPLYSQLRLHDASRARKNVVGCRRGHDDEIDFLRDDARRGKGRAACLDTEVAGGLRGFGDVTLADAGARPDPLVGGVHLFGQIVVGDDLRR